jgi:cytochrome c oxidase cbb3-type subunit 3
MSSACPEVVAVLALVLLVSACERENRRLDKTHISPNPVAQADGAADLQPGQPGRGMREIAAGGGYNPSNAYEVSQGKMLYKWFNCVGCHAQGGGAIGPALMDDKWIYGKKPEEIFTTIMEGRPNGMPSFRGRIPEAQVWQLVAYVQSMSGLLSTDVAPNRDEGLMGAPPEANRKAVRPDEERPKK